MVPAINPMREKAKERERKRESVCMCVYGSGGRIIKENEKIKKPRKV